MKRKLLIALGIVFALLVLVVGAAWWWVHSEAGGRFLRDKVLSATKDALAGRIEVGTLELTGSTLHLRDLKLYTPEGELVAEIAAITAEISLPALIKKTVALRSVTIEGPKLHLASDERGLNLTRAIASKLPPAPAAKPGPGLRIELEQLELTDGFVSFDADEQHLVFDALEIKGHATVVTSPLHLDGKLAVASKMTKPLSAPLSIALTATSPLLGDAIKASVVLSLGDDHLEASGSWPDLTLQVKNTSFRSQTIAVFVPAWPLKPTIGLSADLTNGTGLIHVEAGKAKVDLDAAWTKDFSAVSKMVLIAKDVDLSELLGKGKPSNIDLTAKGNLTDVKSLTGHLTLEGEWATAANKKLASVSAEVKADHGEYFVPKLSAVVPGVSVAANGKLTLKKLNVSGVVDVTDLSKLKATAREFAGIELPAMTGTGHLNVNAQGTLTSPSVNATGTLSGVSVAGVSAQTLEVDVHLPNVLAPFESDGAVLAKQLKVGDTLLDEVKVSLGTRGRMVDVELSTKGLGDLVLQANGKLDEDQNGMSLDAVVLTSSQGDWAMAAPTRLTWAPTLSLQPMTIQSGPQRIDLSGSKKGQKVEAAIALVALDLAKVPRALASEKLGLAGVLDATVRVDGALPRPGIEAKVSLKDGAVRGFDKVQLDAQGAWRDKRAAGQFTISTALASAKGEVNVDVDAVINERPEPVSAHIEVTGVDVTRVATFFKQELPVTAKLEAHLDVSGTADKPQVKLVIDSPEVAVQLGAQAAPLVLTSVSFEVLTRDTGHIAATVSANSFGGVAHVELDTPLTINGLREKLPTVASLNTLPLTVDAEVNGVAIGQLRDSGLLAINTSAEGNLGLRGHLTGTIKDPEGAVTLTANKVVYPPLSAVEASATVTAGPKKIDLVAMITEKAAPLLKVDGSLDATVAHLQHLDALGPEAVKLVATLYPLDLKTLVPSDSTLTGFAGATLNVDGTLDAPRIDLTGSVDQLAFAKAAIGEAHFDFKGSAGHNIANLTIGPKGKDDLTAHGTVDAEIGLAAIRRGLTPSKYPLDVTVASNDFDLAFFSGISSVVRVIGGKLTMNATVQGTIGAPKLDGAAHWVNGRLNLTGFGNYRDIELEAKASNSLISLSKLKAYSGSGWASLTAEATRNAASAWHLTANGEANKFPIVVDDQPVVIATLRLDLNGELVDQFLNIKQLSLPKVLIELPDIRRKDLQNLDRPADIIILRGGRGDLAKRARALELKKAKAKAKEATFTARAVINAQRRIQIKGSDVDLELGLSDGFRLEYANNVQLYGEASVLRGKLSVLGRDFVVQPGSQARFAGVATEPYVNVTAVYTNNKTDDKTKVTVNVVGRGTDIALKVSSEPPLSESEIYTLLATGRPALARGGGSSVTPTQAASVVGSALISQAKTAIAKNVPIDVLDFESGENFSGVKLNVGKYLTDTVFVGYSLNPGADVTRGENPHTVRLEYQMTHSWSLEASAGTAPAAAADVVWSRDF